jgi:hypothetical protein
MPAPTPLAPPAHHRNLAINDIHTLEQHATTSDDLVLLGKGNKEN